MSYLNGIMWLSGMEIHRTIVQSLSPLPVLFLIQNSFLRCLFPVFCPLFFVTARNGYSITLRNSVQASSSKDWWLNSASLKANVILVAFILTNTRQLSVEIAQVLGKFICDFNRLQYYRLLKLSVSANFLQARLSLIEHKPSLVQHALNC